MKTKAFTFKKTVKTVKEFQGISVDLTVCEAADLVAYLKAAATPDGRFLPLLEALQDFTALHGGKSDLVAGKGAAAWACFQMVKA